MDKDKPFIHRGPTGYDNYYDEEDALRISGEDNAGKLACILLKKGIISNEDLFGILGLYRFDWDLNK